MTKCIDNHTAVYGGMDQATLDAAYNNGAAVTESPKWLFAWSKRSERSRQQLDSVLDIRYGHNERNALDLFLSGKPSAPLFIFIHGGYWQKNDKSLFSFVADGLCEMGVDVVIPGYSLAPEVSLSDIVAEIQQTLAFIHANPERFQQDLDRIIIGGWSAGGHLSALAQSSKGVIGVVPISGIFDLEPIARSYLNDKLQLTSDEIIRLSPMHNWPPLTARVRMAVGALELPELIRQSNEYAAAALCHGRDVELVKVPERDHFSILEELAKPGGVLTRMVVGLCAGIEEDPHSA